MYPKKTTKVSNTRKSQNRSLFNDKKSICLLFVNCLLPMFCLKIDMQRVEKVK